jgi:predicted nucleic acid-binding protein
VILDTNALSGFVDGEGAIGEILRQHAQIAIPVIVLGEFRYGIASDHGGDSERVRSTAPRSQAHRPADPGQ